MSRFDLELMTVSTCGKIFELIIFNPIFEKYCLLCPNKFGFRPFDSCENQLLSINVNHRFQWLFRYQSSYFDQGDAHKYVWLASPDPPDFCSKVKVGWSASIKTEQKLADLFPSLACW